MDDFTIEVICDYMLLKHKLLECDPETAMRYAVQDRKEKYVEALMKYGVKESVYNEAVKLRDKRESELKLIREVSDDIKEAIADHFNEMLEETGYSQLETDCIVEQILEILEADRDGDRSYVNIILEGGWDNWNRLSKETDFDEEILSWLQGIDVCSDSESE